MRVVHNISDWLPRTATWLYTQVKALPSSVSSHVVCDQRANRDLFGDLDIHALEDAGRLRVVWDKGLRRLGVRNHTGFLSRQLAALDAQVLHSHFGYTGWANRRCASRARVGHVVTFYGYDVQQLPMQEPAWHSRYRKLFATVDRVLCEGPFMAGAIVRLGCPPDKVRVHHLGVRVDEIRYAPRRLAPGEPLRILLAGTFREKKGHVDGLEAIARVRARGVPVQVTIVGDATADERDQQEKARILEAIERHSLQECVTLAGFLDHARLLATSYDHHVFMAPSVMAADGDSEGGAPVILTEMAAGGMVLVGTTHCDIPNLVRDGETGYLAPERRPDLLAEVLMRALGEPSRWSELGSNARALVESEFNAAVQGRRLAEIYESVAP